MAMLSRAASVPLPDSVDSQIAALRTVRSPHFGALISPNVICRANPACFGYLKQIANALRQIATAR